MNRIKKIAVVLVLAAFCMGTGCGQQSNVNTEPSISQMRSICDLAVMECYYHNVAKFRQDTGNILPWQAKEKHFWIEYSGVVRFGIDTSYVDIQADGEQLTITIPAAEVQSCKVDSSSLSGESYIAAKDSAKISAEDEVAAFQEAQSILEEQARNDKTLLLQAQQRAQTLLENYITNLGAAVGKQYTIDWVYLDTDGNVTESQADTVDGQQTESTSQAGLVAGEEAEG